MSICVSDPLGRVHYNPVPRHSDLVNMRVLLAGQTDRQGVKLFHEPQQMGKFLQLQF